MVSLEKDEIGSRGHDGVGSSWRRAEARVGEDTLTCATPGRYKCLPSVGPRVWSIGETSRQDISLLREHANQNGARKSFYWSSYDKK